MSPADVTRLPPRREECWNRPAVVHGKTKVSTTTSKTDSGESSTLLDPDIEIVLREKFRFRDKKRNKGAAHFHIGDVQPSFEDELGE